MADSVAALIITFNAEATIAQCLDSVRGQSVPVSEIVVVDCGSRDGTYETVKRSPGVRWVPSREGFAIQRNAGARASSARFLLFLDSDMVLDPTVVEECLASSERGAAAAVIPETFVGNGFWGKVRAFEREFYDAVPWIEAARWVSREAYERIGGWDESLDLGEEWDFDERLRGSHHVDRIGAQIECLEGDVKLPALLRKKAYYAMKSQTFEQFSARHPARARKLFSPLSRGKVFAKRPLAILRHPLLTLGLCLLGLAEWSILRSRRLQGWMAANPWAGRYATA